MMRTLKLLPIVLSIFFLTLLTTGSAGAQSPCSHVLFRIDSTTAVDKQAICDAAAPWSEEDIMLYVYLTDVIPENEDAWFALLDQVEIDAGLRMPGIDDSFERSALAFEASARSGVPWTNTITFGEDLFNSNLDNNQTLSQVKEAMFSGLQQGDATAAFSNAITTSYEVTYPPPSRTGFVIAGMLILGIGGGLLYLFVGRPALRKRKREQELNEHLGLVRQNVANLLLAAERLLDGDTPQQAVLYQLYEANNGTFDKDRTAEVTEWIRRSQAALRDAFDLRRDLLAAEVNEQASLEEQVRRWEMIYLTLVGSTPRVLDLTESELKDLLNPLVILEREATDVPLAQQLDAIRREIAGMPLKVNIMEVDPTAVDREGILGYIDLVEAYIKELMDAQRDAPAALQDAHHTLAQAKEAAEEARPFGMTGSETLAGIATRLDEAQAALAKGNALGAIALVNRAVRDLEIVEDLIAADQDHNQRAAAMTEIISAGYRPLQLDEARREMQTDSDEIRSAVRAGDYLGADTWIDELDADGERALALAASWRERQQFNAESIRLMGEKLDSIVSLETEAKPAWEALQAYPQSNWQDIAPGLPALTAVLKDIRDRTLPEIHRLNSMEVQDVPGAETVLAETGQSILQTERRLQALINRVAEVRTAEMNLPEGLQQADAELVQATDYRDREDPKISPEVDELLVQAQAYLAAAVRDHKLRAFIPAMNAHLQAREKTAEALSSARAQVARIDGLKSNLLTVKETAEAANAAANKAAQQQLSAAHTAVSAQQLSTANESLSQARRREATTMPLEDYALAEGLTAAILLYEAAAKAAGAAQTQIERENTQHEQLYRQTAVQFAAAQTAIKRAEGYVRNRAARGEGQEALQRAERTLRDHSVSLADSKESLNEALQEAKRAEEYAREAERKARAAIAYRTPQPGIPFPIPMPTGGFGRIPGGTVVSGRPRTSNRAMQRPSSASSGGGARRSSSFGGASRSSSMGSSRRSSSGGSRRR
jgi:hypothetical protein